MTQAWDDALEAEDDGISWTSEADPNLARDILNGHAATLPGRLGQQEDDVGPMGETRPYAFPTSLPVPHEDVPPISSSAPVLPSQLPVTLSSTPVLSTPTGHKQSDSQKLDAETYLEEVRDTVPPTLDDLPSGVRTQAIDVPVRSVRSSYSAGSVTSSSDGSPVDKLGAALESSGLERERGRNRAQTPIQGSRAPEEW